MSNSFKIALNVAELNLDITLQSGQSFRWFKTPKNQWRGVLGSNVWTLYQDEEFMYCEVTEEDSSDKKKKVPCDNSKINSTVNSTFNNDDKRNHYEDVIRKYFRLDVPLEPLYEKWSEVDQNFKEKALNLPGVRILDQDPVENIFSIICSFSNKIYWTTKLVDRLCTEFGFHIATIDDRHYYSFPEVSALTKDGTYRKLNELDFQFRATYIASSAKTIMEKGGENWLHSLKALKYEECHQNLTSLCGVTDKLADCICLMSMGHLNIIPVDPHTFEIAARNYFPHLLMGQRMVPTCYKEIVRLFQELYGSHAGWAHLVLFSSNLKKFQTKDWKFGNPTKKNSLTIEEIIVSKRMKMS